ncbi:putative quinol monooxygenase [Lichenibacterium ramalinae]|uniref:Antibiotic biosynthesis monooxygenase n=1 Tax=Lichenibacterium ramalinae TaxID=2316527 RepID=A0A4Q2RAR8_9HYPH|nr:antibiotic biosynthesis monooxygenase [Lichenibacterium ramalinae]RYB03263.1 antibiotic biosynthesis monooxygenase [Lichenibacterium ramalinae]
MAERIAWSTFDALPGREAEVAAFLQACRDGIAGEPGTTAFYALETGPGRYATFAVFADDAAFEAHVRGPTADAVRGRAAALFTAQPAIVQATVVATKAAAPRP